MVAAEVVVSHILKLGCHMEIFISRAHGDQGAEVIFQMIKKVVEVAAMDISTLKTL